jgi:hypothetical protein
VRIGPNRDGLAVARRSTLRRSRRSPISGTSSRSWLIHDVAIGSIAGGTVGLVAALFFIARVADTWVAAAVLVPAGAVIAVMALRWERRRKHGAGAVTYLVWLGLVLSVTFVVLLIQAVSTFN